MTDNIAGVRLPENWCNFLFDFQEHAKSASVNLPEIVRLSGRRISPVPQQPLSLARQSTNGRDAWIKIPAPLHEMFRLYRPTPLRRASRLEFALGLNACIYYKYEGANISGSHKLNTALAQAYYYREAGIERLVTGTGAGQWGTAIAYACKVFGLECTVFMVGASLRQKPQRRVMMELFGAEVVESPSESTEVGRDALRADPERIGTLAIATGEALEVAHKSRRTRFAVGSGENCVLLHQTVIGCEAVAQMDGFGMFPDHVVACLGAGSNFGGIGLPFLRAARERERPLRLLAVEPAACPKLTRGRYAYDLNDFSGTTPITRMYTLGSRFTPAAIHAGGLRYHGTSPFLSSLYSDGLFDAEAIDQPEVLEAGLALALHENVLPAPESAHAVAGALRLARGHSDRAEPLVILVNISGHGLFDLSGYEEYRSGVVWEGGVLESALADSLREVDRFNATINDVLTTTPQQR